MSLLGMPIVFLLEEGTVFPLIWGNVAVRLKQMLMLKKGKITKKNPLKIPYGDFLRWRSCLGVFLGLSKSLYHLNFEGQPHTLWIQVSGSADWESSSVSLYTISYLFKHLVVTICIIFHLLIEILEVVLVQVLYHLSCLPMFIIV